MSSEIIIGLKVRVGLFQKSRIKNSYLLVERPLTRTIKHRTGRECIFRSSAFFWGCPVMNFKTTLPFYRAGRDYADLLKEIYTGLPALFSKR
ncbi:MAG: hypothetical protein JRJ51_13375 [Deltaproteobacteria bacterium]|nr:hypothetical protein [Deltaproteobacteria bacterium]